MAPEWDLGVGVIVACGWVNDGLGEWYGLWVLSPLMCVEEYAYRSCSCGGMNGEMRGC